MKDALDKLAQEIKQLSWLMGTGRRPWSELEREILREFYPDTPAWILAEVLRRGLGGIYNQANSMGLKKAPDWKHNPLSNCTSVDPSRGQAGRFPKGNVPFNKGVKGWDSGGRSAQTRFKKGSRPVNTEPVGAYRTDKQGLLQRKVSHRRGSNSQRWRGVHELVWVEHNGPVPKGCVIVFKEGQRTNRLEDITIQRIECVTRAELMRRNSYHNRYPKEIARLIQLQGALSRKIRNRSKTL